MPRSDIDTLRQELNRADKAAERLSNREREAIVAAIRHTFHLHHERTGMQINRQGDEV